MLDILKKENESGTFDFRHWEIGMTEMRLTIFHYHSKGCAKNNPMLWSLAIPITPLQAEVLLKAKIDTPLDGVIDHIDKYDFQRRIDFMSATIKGVG